MAVAKPLVPEEVPEEHRDRIEYDRQWVAQVLYPGRTKRVSKCWVRCSICQMQNDVPVNDVRNYIKGNRAVFPGDHRGCKYPGRYVTQEGYVWLYKPEHPNAMGKKYVAEHIFVMSESLGRPLDTKVESVHHINGDKRDNRIENLQLRNRYHGKGVALQCNSCGSNDVSAVALTTA